MDQIIKLNEIYQQEDISKRMLKKKNAEKIIIFE